MVREPDFLFDARRPTLASGFFERAAARAFGTGFFARTELELWADFCFGRPSDELGRAKAKVAARRAAGITGTFRTWAIIGIGSTAGQAKTAGAGIFFMLMQHANLHAFLARYPRSR